MTADEVLAKIQTFDPSVVAVRFAPPIVRRKSDGRRLPQPVGVRLLMPGLDPIVLRADEPEPSSNGGQHGGGR